MFVLDLYGNKITDEILCVFRSIAYLSDISDGTGSFYFMDSQHKIQVSVTCVYHYLYRVQSFYNAMEWTMLLANYVIKG